MSDPFAIFGRQILMAGSSSPLGAAVSSALQAEGAIVTEWHGGRGHALEQPVSGVVLVLAPPDGSSPSMASEDDHGTRVAARFLDPMVSLLDLKQQGALLQGTSIVTVVSTASIQHAGAHPLHAAAEAALNAFTRTLVLDCKEERLRVNAVVHGWGLSPNQQHDLGDALTPPPSMAEIAAAVSFLLSDASRWLSRSRLILDGGATLKTSLAA